MSVGIGFIAKDEGIGSQSDPTPQYLLKTEAATTYDVINAASTAVDAHTAASDPHPQYLQNGSFLTFKTIAVSGQSDVVADSSTDTLTVAAGANITITTDASTDTITITGAAPVSPGNSFGNVAVSGQSTVVADAVSDTLTLVAGSNITLTTDATGDSVTIASAQQNAFSNVAVAGQTTCAADSATDTLTLEAGTNVTITTDSATDTIVINAASGSGGNAFGTVTVSGQSNVVADSTEDTLTLVAGANVTITTDASTDTVTISSTGTGVGGNAFGNITVSGQPVVVADSTSDTLTLVAGAGMMLATDSTADSVTFRTIQAGTSSRYWHAADPTLTNGGLKTTNTATQNAAALVDLFTKIHNNSTDSIYVEFPSGTFPLNKSISPSGQDQGWTDGQRMTMFFPRTTFTFSGTRTNYNQCKALSGGIWREMDFFSANSGAPVRWGDTAPTGGALPLVTAAGVHRKMAVLFDVTNCQSNNKGIQVLGNLELNGPEADSGTFTQGIIGIGAGRMAYGPASCSTWGHIKITGCTVGIAHFRFGTPATDDDLGDFFTSSTWDVLDIRNSGRAMCFYQNGGDAMNVNRGFFACKDTSYLFGTFINWGAIFMNTRNDTAGTLASPTPKIMDLQDANVSIGMLYSRPLYLGATPDAPAFCTINCGDGSALTINGLHNDQNHESLSGALITMAKTDKGKVSQSGSVVINGMDPDGNGPASLTGVLGVVPNASAVRYGKVINGGKARSGHITAPIVVIADYGATSIVNASTGDRFTSFRQDTGAAYTTITSGALANTTFP